MLAVWRLRVVLSLLLYFLSEGMSLLLQVWCDRESAILRPVIRIAAAFTTVVTSFISEILLPPISLLPFINRNLEEKFAILRRGPKYVKGIGYNTLEQAAADGAVVMAYGYVSTLVVFLQIFSLRYSVTSAKKAAFHCG